MLTLESLKLAEMNVPMGTSWLLAACMEARGKQDLWIGQKPEVLRTLREQAIIQSTESSNRIECVTVSPERLRPVVIGKAKPRDRSEEELAESASNRHRNECQAQPSLHRASQIWLGNPFRNTPNDR